ncbi:MAG: hypothetical protein GF353_20620 [Candidatus Lokiarchaeota archaeon]|nr:hypothetical protein [Candidatus Lokiarchaeota archaeon]
MSLFFSGKKKKEIKCYNCGYKVVKPYPKDQICPKCGKFIPDLLEFIRQQEEESAKTNPKEFQTKNATLSSKLKDKVKIKQKSMDVSLEEDKVELKKGEYVKLLGITSVDRSQIFCSNENYVYLLELTNNLDFIATSILGGELDKMILITNEGKEEKCQFFVMNDIIYIVYGLFPDKKGQWILKQMADHFREIIDGQNVNQLSKLKKHQLGIKFNGITKFILKEYLKLQEVFSEKDIAYVEDKIRIDYLGLSSKSIGVISLLLGKDLDVELPGEFEDPEEELEMKESVLTAKIEALAANTIGNTDAMPRWIAVKMGFQNYRFLTFQKYKNDYFLSLLSEGNLHKIRKVEDKLEPYIEHVIDDPFIGNLKPFNRLKMTLKEFFSKSREFT